jgi:hypothetical protein
MLRAIFVQVGDSVAQAAERTARASMTDMSRVAMWKGNVANLRRVMKIEIPTGYQDETGFHIL